MTARYQFIQGSWVVEDLETAIRQWQSTTSIGPFFINPHVKLDRPLHRGRPAHFDTSVALAQAGPLQIELFQQHDDAPSPYRDTYAPGEQGFHHLGCFVDDIEFEIARHASQGTEIALDCYFGDVRVVYVDTRATMGCMIELLESKPSIVTLFDYIANAAVGWDGTDPIRSIPALSAQIWG